MLKVIEITLLAVSLLVVAGLIVSNSRSTPAPSDTQPPALPNDASEAPDPGKIR